MISFKEKFNCDYEYKFKAPSRVNLIGEHIDYNGGLVLPCAISLFITGYVSKRNDNKLCLYSSISDKVIEVSLKDLSYKKENNWANYPVGMFAMLNEEGYKFDKGLNIYFDSNIPAGSGLSSSAAICLLTCSIANKLYNLKLRKKKMALLAQKVERDFIGLSCGIMDQAAIALSKKDKVMLLDCNKFKYTFHDIDLGDYQIVLLNTNKERKLSESKYNERVDECTRALKILKKPFKIKNLCMLTNKDLVNVEKMLNDDLLFRRTKHVVTENERVKDFIKALENNDVRELGLLLNESHFSLRDDYEVTGDNLDYITEVAREQECCLGARMTGAGFAGCGVAIIKKDSFKEFRKEVIKKYNKRFKFKPEVYKVKIVNGVR